MATNCNIRVDNERAEQTRGGRAVNDTLGG